MSFFARKSIWTILAALVFAASVPGQFRPKLEDSYEEWIKPYEAGFPLDPVRNAPKRPKLIVTVTTFNTSENAGIFSRGYPSSYGIRLLGEGKVWRYSAGPFGTKGGCCVELTDDEQKRVDTILKSLPADKAALPPNGRRVMVLVLKGAKYEVRVFDLARMPDKVTELLRITNSGIKSRVLYLDPDEKFFAHVGNDDGALRVSGNRLYIGGGRGPIHVWNTRRMNALGRYKRKSLLRVDGMTPHPKDRNVLVLTGYGMISVMNLSEERIVTQLRGEPKGKGYHKLQNPRFIHGGRLLLADSIKPSLHIYETSGWKPVTRPREIPASATSYHPAPGGKRAVYAAGNKILLRDLNSEVDIAELSAGGIIDRVVFPPGGKKFALVTAHQVSQDYWYDHRIRLFNTKTGGLLHELFAFEVDRNIFVSGLEFTPDGNYVAAITNSNSMFSNPAVQLWNVKSGRHRASLYGCHRTTGLGLSKTRPHRILMGCSDGILKSWNLKSVVKRIKSFEDELGN